MFKRAEPTGCLDREIRRTLSCCLAKLDLLLLLRSFHCVLLITVGYLANSFVLKKIFLC